MKLRRPGTPLPLLVKDLTEIAARRRTYILRFFYCAALATCFLLFFKDDIGSGRNVAAGPPTLGGGRDMFDFIVAAQFIAIFLFLPATMSGAITYEKERDTLSLLFLTRLRPWEILLQKFLGRLIPMFTMMLLSLPLLGVTYAFGGVSTDYLCSGVFLLFLTCLQVGALSLMFSSFCRGSASAFVCSYLFGALFYLGPALLFVLMEISGGGYMGRDEAGIVFCHFPPYIFAEAGRRGLDQVLAASIPAALTVLAFLVTARVFLVRRAVVRTGSFGLKALKMLDAFWDRANRLTGGVVLYHEPDTLPDEDPLAWLEGKRKSLGKLRYRLRLLMLLEVPVLFLGFYALMMHTYDSEAVFAAILFCLWAIAALLLCVKGASAFSSERAHQTLDVLLSTAMSGSSIIRQKARALRGLAVVLMIPIITVVVMKAISSPDHHGTQNTLVYLAISCATIVIYPPMLTWVAIWVGLRVRSQARAIVVSIAVLVSWCVLPWLLLALAESLTHEYVWGLDNVSLFIICLSPATPIVAAELWSEMHSSLADYGTQIIIFSFVWQGAVLMGFRALCLASADRYLGRVWTNAGCELKAPPRQSTQ